MKPFVCPKCDAEAQRMIGCAPCSGTGIVWNDSGSSLPNYPFIPQPYYPYPYYPNGVTSPPLTNPSIVFCGNIC